MSKVTVKTTSGHEFTYKNIQYIAFASPIHIDLVCNTELHFRNFRIWSDNVTGLFTEIIMEEEDNDSKENK